MRKDFFLSSNGLLGASPDGMISNDHIVEVKCPWTARDKTFNELALKRDFYLTLDDNGIFHMKKSHNYWHQIQGNLFLTGAKQCDLFVWSPTGFLLIPIAKDPEWAPNIQALENFYKASFLPHLLSSFNS